MLIHLTNRTREQTLAALDVRRLYDFAHQRMRTQEPGVSGEKECLGALRAILLVATDAQANGLRTIQVERLVADHPVLREAEAETSEGTKYTRDV